MTDQLSVEDYLAEVVAIGRYARGLARSETARFDALVERMLEVLRGIDPWAEKDQIRRAARLARVETEIAKTIGEYVAGGTRAFKTAYREIINDANGYASAVINDALRTDRKWASNADLVRDKIKTRIAAGESELDYWRKHRAKLQSDFMRHTRDMVEGGRTQRQAAKYIKDGLKARKAEVAMRADTLVRAAHNEGMLITYDSNSDVIEGVQQLETLDRRSCERCLFLDKKQWVRRDGVMVGVGHSILFSPPPVHPNCRGVVVPVVKSFRELPSAIRDLIPAAERASVGGPVSSSLDGEGWVKSDKASGLRRIFGKEKARMLRDGEADLADIVSQDLEILTLKKLKNRRV